MRVNELYEQCILLSLLGELSHQLQESNSRYIVTTPDCAQNAKTAAEQCPQIEVILLD